MSSSIWGAGSLEHGSNYEKKAEKAALREAEVTLKLRELTWQIFQECCFHVDADEQEIIKRLDKAFLQASMDIMSDAYGTDQPGFVQGYEYIRDVAWHKVTEREP
ncbi:hypothetical protein C6Y40_11320 [Alteromonas alba]|uniref:Uncharacterized protein n=1 Tax=Alteromonas alba TaxID=2079529 RepID=A0A2S9VAJ9_9ALTE|nr:hypothetical protein [Alteromonas alba]PRO73497.1 hypothetical protein C6Y40_11320 [Alteromonas alba]